MDVSLSQNKDKRVITSKEILHLQSFVIYTLDYFGNVLLTVIRGVVICIFKYVIII